MASVNSAVRLTKAEAEAERVRQHALIAAMDISEDDKSVRRQIVDANARGAHCGCARPGEMCLAAECEGKRWPDGPKTNKETADMTNVDRQDGQDDDGPEPNAAQAQQDMNARKRDAWRQPRAPRPGGLRTRDSGRQPGTASTSGEGELDAEAERTKMLARKGYVAPGGEPEPDAGQAQAASDARKRDGWKTKRGAR